MKLDYKINFAKAAAVLATKMAIIVKLIYLSLNHELEKVWRSLITRIASYKSAVRKNRTFTRRKTSCRHPIQYRRVKVVLSE